MLKTKNVMKDVEWLIKEKCGCVCYPIKNINRNDYAIVIGWQPGYEEDKSDPCSDDGFHIAAKFAFQPDNSMMQCDYDIDWLMPYDEETGDVYYTEVTIYHDEKSIESDIAWLEKQAEEFINKLEEEEA